MVLPSGDQLGASTKPFDVSELFRGAAGAWRGDVELELVFFSGVGEKCEALAVGRPGHAAFSVIRIGGAGGDALRGGVGIGEIFHVDGGVARRRAFFTGEGFGPGDFGAVGGDGSLFEAVGGGVFWKLSSGEAGLGFSAALRRFSTSFFVPVVCVCA